MKARRMLVGTVLAAVAAFTPAATASAASGDPGFVIQGAPVRSAPYTYASVRWYSVGSWVPLQCWLDTQENGAWRRWFKYSGGGNNWVWSGNVYPQPSVPRC